jgi:protein TonB
MKRFLLCLALLASTLPVLADSGSVSASRTQVYTLAEVDRPPQLMVMARLAYPPELKQAGIAGEVRVELVVDLDGSVRDPVVKSSTRQEFELPALQSIAKWKYKPGRKAKEKVNVRIEETVKFAPKK